MSGPFSREALIELQSARNDIELLRGALNRLLRETMYRDHPEASQLAMDALAKTDDDGFGQWFDGDD